MLSKHAKISLPVSVLLLGEAQEGKGAGMLLQQWFSSRAAHVINWKALQNCQCLDPSHRVFELIGLGGVWVGVLFFN